MQYFGPQFLFLRGDPKLRHHTGLGGELYRFLAPFVAAGLCVAFLHWRRPRYRLILVGLLIAPVAAALTEDRLHATRSVYAVIFWLLLATLGARFLWRRKHWGRAVVIGVCVLGVVEATYYFVDYFGAYQRRSWRRYDTGLCQALRFCFEGLRPERDAVRVRTHLQRLGRAAGKR